MSFRTIEELRQAPTHVLINEFFPNRGAEVLAACRGDLRRVLEQPTAGYHVAHRKLLVAQEIIRRALLNDIKQVSLDAPWKVREFLIMHFASYTCEHFVAIWLDAMNRVLSVDDLFRGTLMQTSVYPREVVRHALLYNACACIFAHNHPTGIAEPSQADELLTANLKRTLALIDVKVLDHFVVASSSTCSFAERGLI